ncbi:hypothetical protein [Burkholderia sp. BE17]|nr:hypothetical protein [Burkholderia sp. BE17]
MDGAARAPEPARRHPATPQEDVMQSNSRIRLENDETDGEAIDTGA